MNSESCPRSCNRQATLIEYNLDLVNGALLAVNSALAQGMDWHQLVQLIKKERKAGNPVRPHFSLSCPARVGGWQAG